MGHCCSKNVSVNNEATSTVNQSQPRPVPASATPSVETNSYAVSPFASPLPAGVAPSPSPARTPGRKFRWPLPPPSPAKPIMAAIMRRKGSNQAAPMEGTIPEDGEGAVLDKNFGYGKNLGAKFELGKEVGRGHFGHTCWAKGKKGELKGKSVAVKIISKAKNFLFTTRDEDAPMKIIDFGLSDFIRPDQRMNDIVGSAYYVAPEVLHRSYSVEADMWSIGVITYILLCGSRPFWARTESGIFRSVLRADPNFDDSPWPSVSVEAKDFVKRLLNKDHRKRMTAAQALAHPWLQDNNRVVPLDILIYKLVKSYIRATPFRRAAQKALSKALPDDALRYLTAQFRLLEPKDGCVSLSNFKTALMKSRTDAMQESRVFDIINVMEPLYYKKMDFEEFCAAAISTYQLEASEEWESIASTAFEYFEQDGNKVISVEELTLELNLGPSAHSLLKDWIRVSDGKLSFLGYTKFLHSVTIRASNIRRR
ncbi:CDPK-related kinase 4 isoform X3 [Gossypium hirsutum]|uniref:non-specific serine/threonine protein kinase n=1 Tax=Gossypium hirsutum TaxID=3635 RepID=A0ABM2YIV6_GOSHI|nr:CDPK-related kinase 4-like isoform X3 [Gossypium hirsutum]